MRFFFYFQFFNLQNRLGEMLKLHLGSSNVESEQQRNMKILRSFLDLLLENMIQSGMYDCLAYQRVIFHSLVLQNLELV